MQPLSWEIDFLGCRFQLFGLYLPSKRSHYCGNQDIARKCHSMQYSHLLLKLYSHYDYQRTSAGLGSKHSTPDTLKCRLWWPCMLVTPVCRFGNSLVATLRFINQNKCHFHHQNHPHSQILIKKQTLKVYTIICTNTTAVSCCAPKKGYRISLHRTHIHPQKV